MSTRNPDLFDPHIKMSAVLRVTIAVDKTDCALCSRDCIFYRSVGFDGSPTSEACSAFAPEFKPLDNWLTSRYRDTACVATFGPFNRKRFLSEVMDTNDDNDDNVEGTSCTCEDDTSEDCPDHPRMILQKPKQHKNNKTLPKITSNEADDIDDDLSDSALDLDHSSDEDESLRPLDANDPVIKDHSWVRYQDKAPISYQIVSVYGIVFDNVSRNVERMLFKRVKVMPCTPEEATLLQLTPGTGYGAIVGDRNGATIEIHRWKEVTARGRAFGSKNKPK